MYMYVYAHVRVCMYCVHIAKVLEVHTRKIEQWGSFFLIYLFYLFLFLAVLGLRCCARAFSSCSEWGLLFVAVRGLIVVASLVVEHGL